MLRQVHLPAQRDVAAAAHHLDVRAGQLEAALARAQVEHVEGRIAHREMAARKALERHRAALLRGALAQRALPHQLHAAVGVDHKIEPRPHQQHAAELDAPVPHRAQDRQAHAPGLGAHERRVARGGQQPRVAECDLRPVAPDARVHRPEFEREAGLLAHALDDAILVAGQQVDREAERANAEREQQRRGRDHRRHPAHHPLDPPFDSFHGACLTLGPARDSACSGCQRRTPAASSSAAVS